MLAGYLPQRINHGAWITAYSLFELRSRNDAFVLPVCSPETPYALLTSEDHLTLPPVFELGDAELTSRITDRILECFPVYGEPAENRRRVQIQKFGEQDAAKREAIAGSPPAIVAFSVDTAVEEHGPHLPLGTDTIQSYSVLQAIADEFEEIAIVRPVEYGQLTWGLPFGFSVDITAELLSRYVAAYVDDLVDTLHPAAVYVVDVHGSITHRRAIVAGLEASRCQRWAFRWLHEPLAEFASARGDQHAGGVETCLVQRVTADLVDRRWWPARESDIVSGQMSLDQAVELTPDLDAFRRYVDQNSANGIVGDVRNTHSLDAELLFHRMLAVARADVQALSRGESTEAHSAGGDLW